MRDKHELLTDLSAAVGRALYGAAARVSASGTKTTTLLSQQVAGAVQTGSWLILEPDASEMSRESLSLLAGLIVSIRAAVLARERAMCVIGGQHIEINTDLAFGLFFSAKVEERIPLALRGISIPVRCAGMPDLKIISSLAFERRGFCNAEALAMATSMLALVKKILVGGGMRAETLNFAFLDRVAAESARFREETGDVAASLKHALDAHLLNDLEQEQRGKYELDREAFEQAGVLVNATDSDASKDNKVMQRMEELYELASHKATRKLGLAVIKSQVGSSWALLRTLCSSSSSSFTSSGAVLYGAPGSGKSTVATLAANASTALSTISIFGRVEFSGISLFKLYPHANALDKLLGTGANGCALLDAWTRWREEQDAELASLEDDDDARADGASAQSREKEEEEEREKKKKMKKRKRVRTATATAQKPTADDDADDGDEENDEDAKREAALKLQSKYRMHRRKSGMSKWYRKTLMEKIKMRRFWIVLDGDFLDIWSSLLSGRNGCVRDAHGNTHVIGESCQFVFELSDLSSASPMTVSRWALCRAGVDGDDWALLILHWFRGSPSFVGKRAKDFLSKAFLYFDELADPPVHSHARQRVCSSTVAIFKALEKALPVPVADIGGDVDSARSFDLLLFLSISWALYGEVHCAAQREVVNECLKSIFKQIISQQGLDTVDFDVSNLRVYEKRHRNGSSEYVLVDSTDGGCNFHRDREARFVQHGEYFLVATPQMHNVRWIGRVLLE